jgi:hypothetical protein
VKRTHTDKAIAAGKLAGRYGLPDVEDLLKDLTQTRKSEAYGDIAAPALDAEDVATEIEAYVTAVAAFLQKKVP